MNYYSLLPLASFAINIFLWTFVFTSHLKSKTKTTYLFFITFCALWGLSDFFIWNQTSKETAHILLKAFSFIWISLSFVYVLFIYLLIGKKPGVYIYIQALITLLFSIISIFSNQVIKDAGLRNWGAIVIPGPLYIWVILLSILVPGIYGLLLIRQRFSKTSGIVKKQLFVLLAGFYLTWTSIIVINLVIGIILNIKNFPSIGSTLISMHTLFIFFAFTKYKFFNVGIEEVAIDIFSKASDGVILVNHQKKITEINESALNILGVSHNEIENTDIDTLLLPPYNFDSNHENLEIKFTKADKTTFGLLSQCNFFYGRLNAGKLITIKNITDFKEAEQEKREKENLLIQVKESQDRKMVALGELAGEIAHDFNNMLTGVLGYVSVLKNRLPDNPDLKKPIDGIFKTVSDAVNMTRKLLEFSRTSEVGNIVIDTHQSILNATDLLKHTKENNIEIKLNLNAKMHNITGDCSQIENVILNLGLNAKDAMPNGGIFSITTSNINLKEDAVLKIEAGTYIQIEISDTGTGIDKSIIPKIFEPFFTTKPKGTGLGLSSIYGIIKKHRGRIDVKSQKGAGTTFTIIFPIANNSK
jgi:signal transduction histidine kinase